MSENTDKAEATPTLQQETPQNRIKFPKTVAPEELSYDKQESRIVHILSLLN